MLLMDNQGYNPYLMLIIRLIAEMEGKHSNFREIEKVSRAYK